MNKQLILDHIEYVKKCAKRFTFNRGIDYEEYVSVGYETLMKVAKRYDVERGFTFKTFFTYRLNYAFLDYYRKNYNRGLKLGIVFIKPILKKDNDNEIYSSFLMRLLKEVDNEKYRECVLLYYLVGLTMLEIGNLYDITEGRVSQIIDMTLKKIKKQLAIKWNIYKYSDFHEQII